MTQRAQESARVEAILRAAAAVVAAKDEHLREAVLDLSDALAQPPIPVDPDCICSTWDHEHWPVGKPCEMDAGGKGCGCNP